MHDVRFIRDNPEVFDRGLARRGLEPQAQRLIALDETRRSAIQKAETAQARRNAASKEIGEAKKKKDEAKAKELMAEVTALKDTIPQMEAAEKAGSKALDDALAGRYDHIDSRAIRPRLADFDAYLRSLDAETEPELVATGETVVY